MRREEAGADAAGEGDSGGGGGGGGISTIPGIDTLILLDRCVFPHLLRPPYVLNCCVYINASVTICAKKSIVGRVAGWG